MKKASLKSLIVRALDAADDLLVSKIGRDKVALHDAYTDYAIVVSNDYARSILSRFLESKNYDDLKRSIYEHAQVFGKIDHRDVYWGF